MKILVAGASGLIGRALVAELRKRGHQVLRLVRRPGESADEVSWSPEAHEIDAARLEGVDGVVNLAGENIAGGRWTEARRKKILGSRVDATRTLVTACARLKRKPAVFVNASAIGFYGDSGDAEVTEKSPTGLGFLPETCLIWETNAEGASRAGIRTVLLRFGVVLSAEGGALEKMLPLFRLGLGGRMGPGTQWMSWVSLGDAVNAIIHALEHAACAGPMNVVAPHPETNREFTTMLAKQLGRPAVLAVPAWALRIVFGQMAVETMLASTRVRPERLGETGFAFQYATLEPALRAAMAR